MDFELDPPRGVGPLQVGMTRAEANAALETLRDTSAISGSDIPGRHVFRPSGLKITIECRNDRLLALSLWRPKTPADTVSFQGIDLFAESALEVVNRLRGRTVIEPAEDDPASFIAPDLLLSLWRPFEADDEPDESLGFFFSSVLLAAPGYYDTPAQAAERARRTGGKL